MKKWTKAYDLIINEKKTEAQYITNRREKTLNQKELSLERNFPQYETTRNFTYLG